MQVRTSRHALFLVLPQVPFLAASKLGESSIWPFCICRRSTTSLYQRDMSLSFLLSSSCSTSFLKTPLIVLQWDYRPHRQYQRFLHASKGLRSFVENSSIPTSRRRNANPTRYGTLYVCIINGNNFVSDSSTVSISVIDVSTSVV